MKHRLAEEWEATIRRYHAARQRLSIRKVHDRSGKACGAGGFTRGTPRYRLK
jgi:hypothetical protein